MDLAGKRVLCVVTGASRGFGHHIATQFSDLCVLQNVRSLHVLLHARPTPRSVQGLERLATTLPTATLGTIVHLVSADLSSADRENVDLIISPLIEVVRESRPEVAVMFNNAGVATSATLEEAMNVNFLNASRLATAFVDYTPDSAIKFVVLSSTNAAYFPIPGLSNYCTSKAAAAMWHACFANDSPHIRVLQYDPGPLRTDMTTDPDVQDAFEAFNRAPVNYIDPLTSAKKLMGILLVNKFESGGHMDFFQVA